MSSVVWTIKVDKKVDKIVEKIVKELGYTSKAEFIREAVREAILRKHIGLLGLYSMDKLSISREDPLEALRKLSSLGIKKELVEEAIRAGKEDVEELITE